jgi:hypothetical protein
VDTPGAGTGKTAADAELWAEATDPMTRPVNPWRRAGFLSRPPREQTRARCTSQSKLTSEIARSAASE